MVPNSCIALPWSLAKPENRWHLSIAAPALEKLATFILGFLTWTGEDTSVKLELHVGRDDIADYLGLTAETVSRTFAKLKSQGVISLPHTQTIIVHHIGRLIAVAAGPDRDADSDNS